MDPVGYFKHSGVSYLYAEQFIKDLSSSNDWKDKQSLDLVIDIGCGPGNTSTYWIDHYLPNTKRLIGIDIDPGMIDLAKEENKKENIEFHVADIVNKDSLKEWEGKVDWIYSQLVFQRVKDQKQGFRNVFYLLKPSGEAVLNFVIECSFYVTFMDLLKTPKWNRILEPTNFIYIPESIDAAHYKQMFEDVGFSVLECVTKLVVQPFESDNECKNFFMSVHSIGDVSEELREEYKKDMFDQYMKYTQRDKQGRPVADLILLQAKLRKDDSNTGHQA